MNCIFGKSLKNIFLIALYKLSIEMMYFIAVCPLYGYRGYFIEINIIKYILSWILTIFIYILMPKGNKVSHRILQMHYVTMIIPFISIFACSNQNSEFCIMLLFCFGVQLFIICVLKQDIRIPRIKIKSELILVGILILTSYVYIRAIRFYGIHLEAINFAKIAEIRSNAGKISGAIGYLIIWQYRLINPYLIVYSLKKKNYYTLVSGVCLQILMFFIVARKEILFSAFLILGLYWWLKRFEFVRSILFWISIASLVSSFIAHTFRLPVSIMIRILIDPAMIKYRHFQVFNDILPKLLFSEGKIGKLLHIEYPYDVPSGYIVSQIHNNVISNENTGYLAYAFDNGGFLIMILMSIVFVCLLILIDAISVGKDRNLVFAFVAYPMYILNDGDLLTCLLSGGFIIALFILWLDSYAFERKKEDENSTYLYVRSLRRRLGIS